MTRTFDLAVVGTGGIAQVHAADAARLGGRAKIVAAVDPDAERLAAFGEKWSVPNLYPDLASMLAGTDVDLVHLCTPPGLHTTQAQECLAHDVTVLCEKPPALSLAEMDAIAAAEAAGRGRFATVFQHRFGSGARRLRRLVREGRFGPTMNAVCHTLWYRPDEYFAVPWRGKWHIEGGGPTMGHGIHQMDLMLSILGDWRQVVAVADRRARPTGTEDISAAIVTMADGAVATVVNSLLSPRETSYLRFDFADATVELEHLYGYEDGDWRLTALGERRDEVTAAWAEDPHGGRSGHGAQLSEIFDALEAGHTPPVGVAESRNTMELIAAIYASAFTGKPVDKGEIGPGSPFYARMDGTGAPWETADAET